MAEGREYISRSDEMGEIKISEEVLATIAASAALEVEGVSSLGSGLGGDLMNIASRKGILKAVRLDVEGNQAVVDISVMIDYGTAVPDVARAIQDSVISALENTSGLQVTKVNVAVTGISFPQ